MNVIMIFAVEYSKNPPKWFKKLQAEIWNSNTETAWQTFRKIGSYLKKSPQFWWSKFWILIEWETPDKKLSYILFFVLYASIVAVQSASAKPLCISSMIYKFSQG